MTSTFFAASAISRRARFICPGNQLIDMGSSQPRVLLSSLSLLTFEAATIAALGFRRVLSPAGAHDAP